MPIRTRHWSPGPDFGNNRGWQSTGVSPPDAAMTSPESSPPGQTGRARLMFLLALGMLFLLGFVLPHGGASEDVSQAIWSLEPVRWTLLALWILIAMESLPSLLAWRRSDARSARLRALLVCLIPPLRAAVAPHAPREWLWLPRAGWVQRNERQFHKLELRLAIPMLMIAVLILPVIVSELLFDIELETTPELAIVLHAMTSVIWFAFAVEFMVLISVAAKKFEYARDHWINLLIIVLPLVAFLRTLALFKALQLAKVSKVFQTVRLRVLLTRAHRIALLLNLIERVLARRPEFYLKVLKAREQRKQKELDEIRKRIESVEAQIAQPREE